MQQTGDKRAREEEVLPDWRILFHDTTAFRNLVESVQVVVHRAIFKVAHCADDGSFYLTVQANDTGYLTIVSASLRLEELTFPSGKFTDAMRREGFEFCVECKHLLVGMSESSASVTGHLEILGYTQEATVHMRMVDPDQRNSMEQSVLSTFVDQPSEPIVDLDWDLTIEFEIARLRELIKKAPKIRAEQLRIQIMFDGDGGTREYSKCRLTLAGDMKHSQEFEHEVTRNPDDDSRIVRAVADGESRSIEADGTLEYDCCFPVDKIAAFVKIVPARVLLAKAKAGLPLMLTYTLGGSLDDSKQYLRYLIAAQQESAD